MLGAQHLQHALGWYGIFAYSVLIFVKFRWSSFYKIIKILELTTKFDFIDKKCQNILYVSNLLAEIIMKI